MKCDFCSSPAPAWRYPAESFLDMFAGRSVGDWLACDECHMRIEADDREGLLRRAMAAPGVARSMGILGRDLTIEYCRDLHNRFWRARRGAAHHIAA